MTKRILICTDLDRTLLPNGHQPESPEAQAYFKRLVARPQITLAFVSGRDRVLIEEAIQEYRLPMPDWVIGDVGTTLYQVSDHGWRHCLEWEKSISADWRGLQGNDLVPLFADLSSLRLQEATKQNRNKLSYYLPLSADIRVLKQEISLRLAAANIKASLIHSVDEGSATGLLDVLPGCATKLHAVEFLMRQEGFTFQNTIFAGDSGNDLPVLASPIRSVLVANADAEVIEQATLQAHEQGNISSLYVAQGGFLSMNGNYSAGILEGIVHYFPETRQWLE